MENQGNSNDGNCNKHDCSRSRSRCRRAARSSSSSSWSEKFKSKAKNRVDDLQEIFTGLQLARKENRLGDCAVLEEQMHQILREFKAELHEPSPASSLRGDSLCSSELSSDMKRLLQLHEEDDDASSHQKPPSDQLHLQLLHPQDNTADAFGTDLLVDNLHTPEQAFERAIRRGSSLGKSSCENGGYMQGPAKLEHVAGNLDDLLANSYMQTPSNMNLNMEEQGHGSGSNFEQQQPQQQQQQVIVSSVSLDMAEALDITQLELDFQEDFMATPSPAAFLGPKCALWDCPRPAQGIQWCQDYCCSLHASMAIKEGSSGMRPVVRPGGIDLKDGPLFAALASKTLDKAVGIPQCEGAATAKTPWNANDLFDINVLEGETIREWLFFDKPRRAFESGNRKQRSLPDYNGRGWHESRKQIMKDFGGLKRSYYMDPQPSSQFEWHLYEYEINDSDSFALYRLELKETASKKNVKGKVSIDPLLDLQNQIHRLSASGEAKKPHAAARTRSLKKSSYNNSNFTASGETPPAFFPDIVEGSDGYFSSQ